MAIENPTCIQGLVTVPFWEYWTSPHSSHYRPYTKWLGDVQWGHLMTHGVNVGLQKVLQKVSFFLWWTILAPKTCDVEVENQEKINGPIVNCFIAQKKHKRPKTLKSLVPAPKPGLRWRSLVLGSYIFLVVLHQFLRETTSETMNVAQVSSKRWLAVKRCETIHD